MTSRHSESRLRAVGRGLTGACPRCGSRGVIASLYELKERCPRCGLRFLREHGFWYGAMWIAMLTVVLVFATMMVVGIALTAPDVPWTGLLIAGLVVNAAIPLLGYAWAKTTWLGINLAIHQPEPSEEADAYTAQDAALREPPASERYSPPGHDPDESGEGLGGQ
jgi:uncharacterized protein (DUF983 family)